MARGRAVCLRCDARARARVAACRRGIRGGVCVQRRLEGPVRGEPDFSNGSPKATFKCCALEGPESETRFWMKRWVDLRDDLGHEGCGTRDRGGSIWRFRSVLGKAAAKLGVVAAAQVQLLVRRLALPPRRAPSALGCAGVDRCARGRL